MNGSVAAYQSMAQMNGYDENKQRSAIQEYMKNGGVNLDPAVTAWCAGIVNAALAQQGIKGTGKLNARSFMEWGQGVDQPTKGDIAVFSRGDPNGWQGHVGFFDGYGDDGSIRVLGGNQSDAVNVSSYPADRLLGFRRPGENPAAVQNRPQTPQNTRAAVQNLSTRSSPQTEAPMQPEQATGLLGSLFPNMTADRQDRLAMGLSGLSMFPNQGVMQGAQQRMGERRDDRKEAKGQASAQQQANRTLQWLQTQAQNNPNAAQALQMLSQGVIDAKGAVQMAMQQPEAPKPTDDMREYEFAKAQGFQGSLQDWQDRNVTRGGGSSEAEQEIGRLVELGMSRQDAIRVKEGILKVVQDPTTREWGLVDLQSGQVKPLEVDAEPAPQQTTSPDISYSIGAGDRSDAFGAEGVFKSMINAGADTLGLGVPYQDVQATVSDFGILKESLINDMASAYPRQPPSWLLKNIEALTPSAGTLKGASGSLSQLRAIKRNFENELGLAQGQAGQPLSPALRQEMEMRVSGLQAALARVDGAISSLGGQDGAGLPSGFGDALGQLPEGVTPQSVWEAMSPEDRALWAN
jgi:uncharacterized protein (TIGR02594 family)